MERYKYQILKLDKFKQKEAMKSIMYYKRRLFMYRYKKQILNNYNQSLTSEKSNRIKINEIVKYNLFKIAKNHSKFEF